MTYEKKRYVITSAQANARVNKQFLSSLETYCLENDAELLILPMQGNHISEDELADILYNYNVISGKDYRLNKKIKIKDYKVKPQAIRPLTGLEQLVKGDTSAIIAGTKINLRSVPNSNSRMAKMLMTTGAVTHPRYAEQHRIGKIAKADHEYGATIVEITGDKSYHMRYIQALKNGKFCDIDKQYHGTEVTDIRMECLVPGDIHTLETDPEVLAATMRMIERGRPKNIFLHDLFDGKTISHHNLDDLVELQHNHKLTSLSLKDELQMNAWRIQDFLKVMPEDSNLYIVASNHNEFLDRYLRSGRFIKEPHNIDIAVELLDAMFRGKNPLEVGISRYMKIPKNVHFLNRTDDLRIRGYYFNFHGDKGINGARGSSRSFSRSLEKCIVAHSHSPNKERNAITVGTNTYLKQRYNQGGPSSWLHTNGVLYPIGTTQLLNIVNGTYCAKDKPMTVRGIM